MGLENLLNTYKLGEHERTAVTNAYNIFRIHHAPFVTSVSAQMLPDLRRDADANHAIAFLGRDGLSYAIATRALDPDFYAHHCHRVLLSRAVVDAAIQDLETHRGTTFPQLEGFRTARHRVNSEKVTGSFQRLTQYLRASGVPVGHPGSSVTVVDNSYKGTIQELLAAAYPNTMFNGRYMAYGASPHDPHPGSKIGYVSHISHPGLTGQGLGLPFSGLPTDRPFTFASQGGIRVIEDTLHGPYSSPTGVGAQGPEHRPQRESSDSSRGINPVLISPELRNPTVREAVKAAALIAVHDFAVETASRQHHPGWDNDLIQQREDFVQETRAWLVNPALCEPGLRQLLDSFVRRDDKVAITRLQDHIQDRGVPSDLSQRLWQAIAQAPNTQVREAMVDAIIRADRGRSTLEKSQVKTKSPGPQNINGMDLSEVQAAVRAAFPGHARDVVRAPRSTRAEPSTTHRPPKNTREQGTER